MKWNTAVVLIAATAITAWVYQARASKQSGGPSGTGSAAWMTDANAALARARAENRTVVMDFTGSDWCGWCIKLDEEVFSTAEFADYASKNLVLLKLDFPRRKKLPDAEQKQNEELAKKYSVTGFPTIVVLHPNGSTKGRLGYQPGGPGPWLAALKKLN